MNTTIEPEKVPHIHQWFGTGEMERGEMRCISCGMWGKTYDEQAERIAELEAENAELRKSKDGAYLERNRVVAALSTMFAAGKKKTQIPGWSDDWNWCVFIDLPTGQASWHFHDSHVFLFEHLEEYTGEWDGHSTEEKYERLSAMQKDKP